MATSPETVGDPTAADLPGYPLGEVLLSTARQVFAFSKDAFGYDGCPTPLQQCLKQPAYRRHALRELQLATELASAGANNVEIDTLLNSYYASFAPTARATFDLLKSPCLGSPSAPVTIVEFSDFECPHCAMARPMLEALVTTAGLVRLCYKPFPLSSHPNARSAAEAALFARDQGKFWEMHDALFNHQGALGLEQLISYGTDLGLDPGALRHSLEANVHGHEIDVARSEGTQAGIKGTPAVFMNGRGEVLPLGPEYLAHEIDDELEWQHNGGKWVPDAAAPATAPPPASAPAPTPAAPPAPTPGK
jgi:protein-disulfide isomerase